MVTIQQVQRGVARFVDNHVAGAYNGIEKMLILGGATLLTAGLPNILKAYCGGLLIGSLGVFDAEKGMVDIDALYNAFVPHMGSEKLPIKLPKVGSMDLGTLKLDRDQIDILVRYIKEA